MAGDTELENLVVRLTGDGSDFQRMLSQSAEASNNAAKQLEEHTKKIEGFGGTINKFAASALGAIASLGITSKLREALGGFQDAEGAEIRLRSALQSNGRQVDSLMKDYQEFAGMLQKVTTAEDDAVISMLAMAESMGVTGDQAKRAVKNAVALAAAKGGEAEGYIRVTAALEQGRVIARAINPALMSIKNESQRAIKAQEMLAKMFDTAEASAGSSAGQIKQLKIAYGNLLEEFGRVIAEGIAPVVRWLKTIVDWFQNTSDRTKLIILSLSALAAGFLALGPIITMVSTLLGMAFNPVSIVLFAVGAGVALLINHLGGVAKAWEYVSEKTREAWEWLKPIRIAVESFWEGVKDTAAVAWEWIKQKASDVWEAMGISASINWEKMREDIQYFFIAAEFGLRNFQKLWELAYTYAAYQLVKLSNQFEYIFIGIIPDILDWFANNWRDILDDLILGQEAALQNLADNLYQVIANLPGLISGKVSFDEIWKPLLTGFQRKSKELVIGDRVVGAVEGSLSKEIDQQLESLSQSFDEFSQSKLKDFWEKGMIEDEDLEEATKAGLDFGTKLGKGIGDGVKSETAKFDVALAGSTEALSRIADYKDRIAKDNKEGASVGEPVKKFDVAGARTAEASSRKDANTDLLKDIKEILKDGFSKATSSISVAELE